MVIDAGLVPGLVDRARVIQTSTWSDALDECGLPASVMTGPSFRAGSANIFGPAVTIAEEVAEFGDAPLDDFALGSIFPKVAPGAVLVFAASGSSISTLGGVAARHALRKSVAGVVIDGGCRDLDELMALGLPIWSTHVTPRSGKGRIRVVAVNAPVVCGGVTVRPGDWVAADRTGVVVLPAPALENVLSCAEKLAARDDSFEAALARGLEFGEAVEQVGHV
ncbi:MAG TPA: RraA family protein [Actinophytocola sp.]|jgi:regulator of RNase E activity RraA|nr:RraA family protein [Actinophytocola sp.]